MLVNSEIKVPNGYGELTGYTGIVLLHQGSGILVWLTNANRLPFAKRYVWIDKSALR